MTSLSGSGSGTALRSIAEIARNQRLKDNENERLSGIEMLRELLDDNCQLTRFLRRRVESTSAMVFGRCLNSCREIHTCSSSKASEVERSRFASICDLRSASFCSVVANGISAGDEAARRRILAGNRDERSRELRGVAGLSAVL